MLYRSEGHHALQESRRLQVKVCRGDARILFSQSCPLEAARKFFRLLYVLN